MMEDFKRPNHPDFMDSSELSKVEFSGLRHNSITNDMEIWLFGKCERRISKTDILLNPNAIDEAYEEVFALNQGTVKHERE